jgi:DNA-binding NarL/FixJ family response regulator
VNGPRPCPFTETELAVLRRMADGVLRKLIAGEMRITKHALDVAVSRMLNRVGASNATHLVAMALRAGWIK